MDEENKEKVEEEEVIEDSPVVAKVTTEELEECISKKDHARLLEIFELVPTIDIAEAADELEPAQLIYIFHTVESNLTADFFDDLSQESKENLIKAMTDKELVALVNEQAADDIVDTVGDMPANLASRVLKAADKDMRKDINALLKYKEGTAGSLMTTEYLEFLNTMKVEDAIDEIRERGKDAETVYTVFVRNRQRHFVGTVDLDDLIFAKKTQTLDDIMNQDIVSVSTNTDQEEIGQVFRRYDLNALAVLNDDQRLVGIITIDDAVDVVVEESQEDLARLTNMEPSEKPYLDMTPWENAKKCIPWIIALLILGTFTTLVLDRIEKSKIFTMLPMLIAFVPTLMDTGGNAGGQTTGLMIRGLAVKDFTPKSVLRVLGKEIQSALIVASFVASFAFVWVLIEQYTGIVNDGENFAGMDIWHNNCWSMDFFLHSIKNAGLIAVTMFIAITIAKTIGTLLPLGAAAIKKDPALLSQPMLTTIMDVTILLLFMVMAMLFFPNFA